MSVEKPVEEAFRRERVSAVADRTPTVVARDASVEQLLEELRGEESGCVVVVDTLAERRPVGVFTERDYLDKLATLTGEPRRKALSAGVSEYMTASPRTVREDESLDVALRRMTDGGYRHLPVVGAAGELTGVLSVRDIIQYLAALFPVEIMNLPPRLTQDEKIHTREGG